MIAIESKCTKRENILKKYPDAVIADVTSQATDGLVKITLIRCLHVSLSILQKTF